MAGIIQEIRYRINQASKAQAVKEAAEAGQEMGRAAADPVERAVEAAPAKALRDGKGRFVKAGQDAGAEAGRATADAMNRSLSQRIRGHFRGLSRDVQGLFGKMGQEAGSIFKNQLLQYFGVTAIMASIAQATRFVIGTNVTGEKLQTQLLTLEGTEEAARAAFKRIEDFAIATPFQIEEITEAFIRLRGQGLDPTNESLALLADFASAKAGRIDELVAAATQAAFGETERLKAFHVAAQVAGNQITLTYGNMTRTVGRNAREVVQFLEDVSRQNFAGAAAREMQTLGGAFSNLEDSLGKLARAIGAAGLNREIQGLAQAITALADTTTGSSSLSGWVRTVVDLMKDLGSGFRQARLEAQLLRSDMRLAEKGLDTATAWTEEAIPGQEGRTPAALAALRAEWEENKRIRREIYDLRGERRAREREAAVLDDAARRGVDLSGSGAEMADNDPRRAREFAAWRTKQAAEEAKVAREAGLAKEAAAKASAKALDDEVKALRALHEANALTVDDMVRIVRLRQEAEAAMGRGGSPAERAALVERRDALRAIDDLARPYGGWASTGSPYEDPRLLQEGGLRVTPRLRTIPIQPVELPPDPNGIRGGTTALGDYLFDPRQWDDLASARPWAEVFLDLENHAEGAAEVMANAWASAFQRMKEEGATVGNFLGGIARSIGKAMLSAVATFAGKRAQQAMAEALGAIADALRNASSPWTWGMVGSAIAANKAYLLEAAAWSALGSGSQQPREAEKLMPDI